MEIPGSLKLMGHTLTIELFPPIRWKQKDCVGWFNPREMKIGLLKRPGTGTEQAFFHELTHACLYVLGDPHYDDEQWVDTWASLWHQAMTTQKPRQPRRSRKNSA